MNVDFPVVIAATLALLYVPGRAWILLVAPLLSGWRVWAASPAFSLGLALIVAQVSSWMRVEFVLPEACLVVSSGALLVFRRRALSARTVPSWSPLVGVLLAVSIGVATWWDRLTDMRSLNGGYDAAWHAYLVAWLAQVQDGGAGRVASLDPLTAGPVAYYPYGFHLVSATVGQTVGAAPAVVMTAALFVGCAIILPAGLTCMVSCTGARDRLVLGAAPVVGALTYVFPYRVTGLIPYAFTLSMIPGFLGLAVSSLRPASTVSSALRQGTLVAPGFLGLLVGHPSTAFLAALMLIGWLAIEERQALRDGSMCLHRYLWDRARWLSLVGLVAFLACLPWILATLSRANRTAEQTTHQPLPMPTVVGQLLTLSQGRSSTQRVLVVLLWLGVASCLWLRQHRLLLLWFAIAGGLFLLASDVPVPGRATLITPWYGETRRLAASAVLFSVPIVAIGLARLLRFFARFLPPRSPLRLAVPGLLVFGLALVSVPDYIRDNSRVLNAPFRVGLFTPTETNAWRFLATTAPRGCRVMNDWRDGSGWMYAVAGVTPAAVYQMANDLPDRHYLLGHLNAYRSDRKAAQIVSRLHICYAIVDSTRLHGFQDAPPGLRGLDRQAGFTKVFSQDGTSVYALDAK